jgi:hypothetical protein
MSGFVEWGDDKEVIAMIRGPSGVLEPLIESGRGRE